MKTFVADNVFTSFADGIIVVKAPSKGKAIEMIKNKFNGYGFYEDCNSEKDCSDEMCLKHRVREMNDNELVYVYGGH